jgi:hypothetical protein
MGPSEAGDEPVATTIHHITDEELRRAARSAAASLMALSVGRPAKDQMCPTCGRRSATGRTTERALHGARSQASL